MPVLHKSTKTVSVIMSDKYNIDTHKLMYHPDRVAEWLKSHNQWEEAKKIYPLYIEITPFGACNHRCVFCSVDYLGYKNISQCKETLLERLDEMSQLGVKAIMFAGEGEPALWKPLPDILDFCTKIGIDTSLTTNMIPFNESNTVRFVRNCKWIKTSINAGTPKTYAKIHQAPETDFEKVINNFRLSIEVRNNSNAMCTIGGQMLLLPENAHEGMELGRRLKDIGADYLVVKPYTQSLYGISQKYKNIDYSTYDKLEDEMSSLEDEHFKVIIRKKAMDRYNNSERNYKTCCATPFFWAYIMADGSLYGCSAFLGNEKFLYGNINENTFKEIWEGKKRRDSMRFIQDGLDLSECRINCRMDEVNQYLWKLKNPDEHVNFI